LSPKGPLNELSTFSFAGGLKNNLRYNQSNDLRQSDTLRKELNLNESSLIIEKDSYSKDTAKMSSRTTRLSAKLRDTSVDFKAKNKLKLLKAELDYDKIKGGDRIVNLPAIFKGSKTTKARVLS